MSGACNFWVNIPAGVQRSRERDCALESTVKKIPVVGKELSVAS